MTAQSSRYERAGSVEEVPLQISDQLMAECIEADQLQLPQHSRCHFNFGRQNLSVAATAELQYRSYVWQKEWKWVRNAYFGVGALIIFNGVDDMYLKERVIW